MFCVADITCKLEPMHLHLRVAGGQAANEKITVGHKLQFYCANEYVLDGSDILTCLESGQWSAPFPTCSGMCYFLFHRFNCFYWGVGVWCSRTQATLEGLQEHHGNCTKNGGYFF